MNHKKSYNEVLIEKSGLLGLITFNRPQALNSLTLEMIRPISAALKTWENDKTIKAVIFRGAGGRAFCAGGDLKIFYRMGMDYRRGQMAPKASATFFAEEYSLDKQIFHYSKPTIAFMDGIVMGGGFGIGGNCAHRIVTERTVFAMPEVGIGFFPDVGSMYRLLRTPGHKGRYLALTGSSVNGADMLAAGLAESFILSFQHDKLLAALERELKKDIAIKDILYGFQEDSPRNGTFEKHGMQIEKIFGESSIREILEALIYDGTPWAAEVFDVIKSRSPNSLMVTNAHLERSKGQSFDDVIAMDFILAQHFLQRQDFYEGIRAAVIEKDRHPRWNPASLEQIKESDIQSYFVPTGYNLGDVQIFNDSVGKINAFPKASSLLLWLRDKFFKD